MSMTWHLGAQHRASAVIVAALWVTACGSSGSKRAQIELLAPEDMAELTIEDDQDPDLPGVQYEVRAQTTNIRAKTVMLLVIPGENNTAYFTEIDEDGLAIFEKATLPPGAHTFHINTANASVSSDEYSYTLKTLVIQTPKDGSGVAFGDDTDQDKDGLQINVTVKAYAVDGNEDISLTVDGQEAGDPVSPNSEGVAVFQGVTLGTGTRTLKATSGDVESSETKVSVNEACASVTFVTPEVPADSDRLSLGGGDSCPASGDDFTADFVISTDAGEGRDVELTVNNTTKQKTKVSGALAKFEGVVLNRRMSANEVSVTVQGAGGVTCAPVPYPKDIIVDCDGSDCSIGSPIPYSGEDSKGDPAFYLNKSMLNGDGFDIRVDSDSGVLGRNLQLVIDGRDGRNALSSEAVPNGNRLSATFSKVKLANGAHTIEGRCTDESGNVTESGELTWIVDTDVCGVSISAPAANSLIVPGNDTDANASNGLMVEVKASIDGSDCTGSRSAVCNPSSGISDGDFSTIVNGAVDTQVALTSGADQQVCVEARDLANNIGRGTVAVKYRSTLPNVEIESPGNDATFNALGNDDHTADSDPGTSACNADFRVACTELGGTVQLHRTDENGPIIASGTCETQANGDPAIPSGFAGRAKLNDVSFLSPAVDNTTLVATQTVAGNSDQVLVGKSEPIALTGWCELPQVAAFPACPASQIELPMSGNATLASVFVFYGGAVADRAPGQGEATVTAVTDGAVVSSGNTATLNTATNYYTFSNVNLGPDPIALNLDFAFTDDYANTSTQTCPITLVADLPTLSITSPTSGAPFGPAGGCTPMPASPDQFGVPVAITLDQTGMRGLGYRINGGTLVPVTITGTTMNLCIPVSDGLNTIAVELASTVTNGGTAKPSVDVDVTMLNVTAPTQDQALLPVNDVCDPGFGVALTATVSPTFNGATYTATAGVQPVTGTVTGGAISTCVPLSSGANTITLSLDGKNVSRTVDVAVVGATPTKSIPITTVNIPSGATFRTGTVTLGWATPEQDYTGQLKSYELRCASSAIAMEADAPTKDAWWNAASVVALGGSVAPPATSSTAAVRVGDNSNCVLRAKDAGNQLSPIAASTNVNYSFREVPINVAELKRMGYAISAVGDINGDGVSDVLVGGTDRAYLLFGGANVTSKTAPDVTLVGAPSTVADRAFGTRLAALGDVNGDGTNDFAIGYPRFNVSSPTAASSAGAVYLFYGRKSGDPWPASIDLTSTSATTCGADVCFYGELMSEGLGWAVAPIGDFDTDGRPDFAITAPTRGGVGRLYAIAGRAFQTAPSRPSTFWNVAIRMPSSDPVGFYVDGAGNTGTNATASTLLGSAAAPAGNSDGMPGTDILLSALGSGATNTSKLLFLSGRANDGTLPRLKTIPSSELVLKDTAGAAFNFGVGMTGLRNWYDNGQSGIPDVAVFDSASDSFHVYLGDNTGGSTFSNSARLTVTGAPSSGFANLGLSASSGYNPNIGNDSRSDIDGDGLDDLCVGTAPSSGTTPIYVFYGSDLPSRLSSNAITYLSASQVNPTARSGAGWRTVQPVGDITGDGWVDLIVGEPTANTSNGGFTILY
jgi:glycosylphosphatidylinositol phospholipase D